MASVPISISTTATLIHTPSTTSNETVWVHVDTASPLVYLGGASVTSSTGLPCGPGSDVSLYNLGVATAAPAIYGIVASGSVAGSVKLSTNTS